MNSDHSLNIDPSNIKLSQIIDMKSRLDQVHTTHIPLVWSFTFLEPNVSTCFELSLKSANTGLVGVSEFFIDSIEDVLNMIDLLFFQVVYFL